MRTLLLFPIVIAGCESEPSLTAQHPNALAAPPATVTIEEAAPVDSDGALRDPFVKPDRAYRAPHVSERRVAMHDYPIDQAKVGGTADGLAMLVDPKGFGWNVAVGDLVGKDEEVANGISNWRVDKISGDRVYLSLDNGKSKSIRIGDK